MRTFLDFPIQKVTFGDKNYPKLLSKISKPPKQIYYRGELKDSLFEKSLAVVGSRHVSRYGQEVIQKFIPQLVSEGVVIISGFMYGVDTLAHTEAVNCGGRTVAILGNGINICYPPENEKLYLKILEAGGVVASEYEPDQKAQLWMYRERNRVVSGLSSIGVLVVEAAIKSGSLVTAEFALKQNKKLWAVPGQINSKVSEGTNFLIKESEAKMATSLSDILEKKIKVDQIELPDLTKVQSSIYKEIDTNGSTIDELSVATGIPVVEISKEISMMGLKGVISESGGKIYKLGK